MPSRREVWGALTALIRLIGNADSLAAIRRGATLSHAKTVAALEERGQMGPVPWTPFQRVSAPEGLTEAQRQMIRDLSGLDDEEPEAVFARMVSEHEIWMNSRYQVAIRAQGQEVHLSIKRLDQLPIHDWRDLQRIKDELVGPECEALELYPANSRLVDTSTQYHLWAVRDPKFRFPFGYTEGLIMEEDRGGAAQRPQEE